MGALVKNKSTRVIRKKEEVYTIAARIKGIQIARFNAVMYSSNSTMVDFINNILNVIDYHCNNNTDKVFEEVFGYEFYQKFIKNYCYNFYQLDDLNKGEIDG